MWQDTDPNSMVGMDFDGRYKIDALLRTEGPVAVYRASDTGADGRQVALQIMGQAGAVVLDHVRRFERRAQSIASLDHPACARILDAGTSDDSLVYLVTEPLEGETLAQRLQSGKPLSAEESTRIMIPIVRCLALAHEQGLVHGAVEPANIFLCRDGNVKLLDFGLSACLPRDGSMRPPAGLADTAPAYAAPEQARRGSLNSGADVYSFGATLYHALAGHPPFIGDAETVLQAHLNETPEPLDQVPSHLSSLVAACLGKYPYSRPRDAAAILERLNAPMEPAADEPEPIAPPDRPTMKAPQALQSVMPTRPLVTPAQRPTPVATPPQSRRPVDLEIAASAVASEPSIQNQFAAGPVAAPRDAMDDALEPTADDEEFEPREFVPTRKMAARTLDFGPARRRAMPWPMLLAILGLLSSAVVMLAVPSKVPIRTETVKAPAPTAPPVPQPVQPTTPAAAPTGGPDLATETVVAVLTLRHPDTTDTVAVRRAIEQATKKVRVTCKPRKCWVRARRQRVGRTPLTLELQPDEEVRVSLHRKGYKTWRGTVDGTRSRLKVKLEK